MRKGHRGGGEVLKLPKAIPGLGMAMKCPNCGAENPEDQKLCGDCGGIVNMPPQARLGLSKCPNCGFDNPEGRRFCADCGSMIPRTPLVIAPSEEGKKKED